MRNATIKILLAVVAVITLAATALYGCISSENNNLDPTVPGDTGDPSLQLAPQGTSPADSDSSLQTIEITNMDENVFKANTVKVDYTGDPLPPVIVTSYEQWEALTDYNVLNDSSEVRVLQPLSDYNEATFDKHILIVGEIVMNTGSATPTVTVVDTTGDIITVSIELDRPEVATADMAQVRVFIVLPRTEYKDQTQVVFDYPSPISDNTSEG